MDSSSKIVLGKYLMLNGDAVHLTQLAMTQPQKTAQTQFDSGNFTQAAILVTEQIDIMQDGNIQADYLSLISQNNTYIAGNLGPSTITNPFFVCNDGNESKFDEPL